MTKHVKTQARTRDGKFKHEGKPPPSAPTGPPEAQQSAAVSDEPFEYPNPEAEEYAKASAAYNEVVSSGNRRVVEATKLRNDAIRETNEAVSEALERRQAAAEAWMRKHG